MYVILSDVDAYFWNFYFHRDDIDMAAYDVEYLCVMDNVRYHIYFHFLLNLIKIIYYRSYSLFYNFLDYTNDTDVRGNI